MGSRIFGENSLNSIRSVGAASVTICLSLAGFAPGIGAAAISDDQVAVDRQAVAVFAMPSVQAEKSRLRALYVEDPEASQQDGRARLEAGLGSVAFASVLAAANNDPDRPKISWATAATHDWRALHVPGSGHGIDNPDNFYRNIPIDGAARYTITGRIRQDGPLQESFTLYKTRPGSGGTEKQAVFEGSPVLGALTARDLSVASDGSFTITIDHDGANGPGNHIQSGDNPDEILIVRDTLSDWSKERPNGLAVARADGPPLKPQPTNKVIAEQAIQLLPHAPVIGCDLGEAGPVSGLVSRKPAAHRIDAKGKQPVKLLMARSKAQGMTSDQVPVKCFEVADVENDAVPLRDRPVIE